MISSNQIKAARAWMDWTREQLAEEAGVSPGTIRNLEMGKISLRSLEAVRAALVNKGFKFYGTQGFIYQDTETRTYEGRGSCEDFYNDLLETVTLKGGEIAAIFSNYEQMLNAFGMSDIGRIERLERLATLAVVKCLLSDIRQTVPDLPSLQFRATTHNPVGPLSQLVYGDKTAVIVANGKDFVFHVVRSVETVQTSLRDFRPRWDAAIPMPIQSGSYK